MIYRELPHNVITTSSEFGGICYDGEQFYIIA